MLTRYTDVCAVFSTLRLNVCAQCPRDGYSLGYIDDNRPGLFNLLVIFVDFVTMIRFLMNVSIYAEEDIQMNES